MEEILEIVLQAVDNASSIFSSVTQSADEMGSSLQDSTTEGSSGFDDLENSAQGATGTIQDIIDYCQSMDGSGPRDTAEGMDELENEAAEADSAVRDLGDDLGIINSSMMLQTAEQIGAIGDKAEGMAQEMNTAAISVGQLATQTGIAEPQMVSLINTISNATFPNDEAMLYVKSLDQMHVSAENLGESATNIDRINDAFGLGAQTTNSLAQELGVLGVDMNDVSSAFNALAYANDNTVGGMQNYYSFLRKYDAQFKELGFDVDQSSIIIAAATQKFGGGRAALSGLSDALKEAGGDTRALEQALGLQAGTLDHASEITGQYSGVLEQLAGEEAEHKTLLDQLGAAWEDFSLSMSAVLSPLSSVMGLIGQAGSFAMQINGLVTLGSSMKSVVGTIREMNIVQTLSNVLKGEAVVADTASAAAVATEGAAAAGASGGFWAMAAAELAALWPILAIIAAVALFIAAVYEIGKAFGWWTDVSSMLDAIWDGLNRMWQAFINHPDVQAAIQVITAALQWLWNGIVQAGQAVLEFFGISTGGDFDVVRALIESIGFAWQVISTPIRTVIWLLQAAWSAGAAAGDAIGGFYNDTIAPFAEFISGVFAPVWQTLIDMWNGFTEAAMPAVEVIQQFMQGNANLGDVAVAVITAIWNMWLTFTVNLSNLLLTLAGNMWSWASQAGMNFLNGIATYLSQLALRVYNYLNSAKINIINQLSSWVSNARTKASQFVTGIISFISQLPARVYNYLVAVVSRIVSAGQQWVNSAKDKAKEVVDNVGNTLSDMPNKVASALSGVASAIAKPFEEAYNRVADLVGKIKDKASELSGISLPAMGGDLPMGGDVVVSSSDSNVVLDHNLNVTLDFSNVPGHISTEQLADALSDRNVIRELVNNRDFQLLDNQAKEKLNLKINRARGV